MITSYQKFILAESKQLKIDAVQPNKADADEYIFRLDSFLHRGMDIESLQHVMGSSQVGEFTDHRGMLCYRLYDVYKDADVDHIKSVLQKGRGEAVKRLKPVKKIILSIIGSTFSFPKWINIDWAVGESVLTNDIIVSTEIPQQEIV